MADTREQIIEQMARAAMRILTVRQPYAGLIAADIKPVENRTKNIAGSYRGPVAIHSAKIPAYGDDDPRNPWDALYDSVGLATNHDALGVILCVVDLVDVHYSTGCPVYVDDAPWPLCSRWSQRDSFHLSLTNPRLLPTPIPYRGALGLRELPAEVEQQIWQQIGGE